MSNKKVPSLAAINAANEIVVEKNNKKKQVILKEDDFSFLVYKNGKYIKKSHF